MADNRNAADAASERLAILKDLLQLAEAAPAYRRGEQWAVSAVVSLRHEVANFQRQHFACDPEPDRTAWPVEVAAKVCPVFRHITA